MSIREEEAVTHSARPPRSVLMLVIGILGISMSAIFVRYSQAPSLLTAAYRLLWTVLLMSPAVLLKKETRRSLFAVKPRTAALSALSGVLLALHFATWFESLRHTSVASSTMIVCTEAIWVALGYRVFLKGRLGGKAVAAMAVTLAGSLIIAWSDGGIRSCLDGNCAMQNSLYGDLLALAAAIAVGAYTLLGRVVRGSTGTTEYTYIVYVSAAITLAAAVLLMGYPFFGYGYSGIISGLLLAVFSTILGHSIFSWCLKYFSPAFVSASKLCEPVISSVFAALLFGELPTALQIVGGVIVLAGVVYYTLVEVGGNVTAS